MRTDVLQVVAISTYCAEFLRGAGSVGELLTTHSAFARVHAVEFRRNGNMHGGLMAESVHPWMRRLSAEGVVVVRPLVGACTIAGEAEEPWGILTDGDRGMEIWRPTWRSRVAGYEDPKPYRVSYLAERMSRWLMPPVPTVSDASVTLTGAVIKAVAQLRSAKRPDRAFVLARCLELQTEGVVKKDVLGDLVPGTWDPHGMELARFALQIAQVAATTTPTMSDPQLVEVYAQLWHAAMSAFEAAGQATTYLAAA